MWCYRLAGLDGFRVYLTIIDPIVIGGSAVVTQYGNFFNWKGLNEHMINKIGKILIWMSADGSQNIDDESFKGRNT